MKQAGFDGDGGDSAQTVGSEDAARAAIEHVQDRAAAIRDEHCQRALSEVRRRGETTPEDEAALISLAYRLTDRLLAQPRTTLYQAARRDDDQTARVAYELFGE